MSIKNIVTSQLPNITTYDAGGNITGVVVANVTSNNLVVNGNAAANYFVGNGSQLTGLPASYSNANVSTYLASNSNVTITTTGNISGGNVVTGGLISVTGNATAGNILTAGIVSATANVTGGNILTAGLISVTGNTTGGNILTAGIVSATGNATVGNISATNHTGTTVSVSGNVTGGNILTAGLISVTGNATAGNISATNHTGTTVSVSGNVTGGNILTDGLISVTGNATVGNITLAGLANITGNATAGNVLTAGLMSATGNVTAGNIVVKNGVGNITLATTANSDIVMTTGTVNAINIASNSIALGNTSGSAGLFINPVRNDTGNVANAVYYNTTTKEVTYAPVIAAGYLYASRNGSQTTGLGTGSPILFDRVVTAASTAVSLNTSTGRFTLEAGKTYRLMGSPGYAAFSGVAGFITYQWFNFTTGTYMGLVFGADPVTGTTNAAPTYGPAITVFTPSVTTVVQLNINNQNLLTSLGSLGLTPPWADIEVIAGNAPFVVKDNTISNGTSNVAIDNSAGNITFAVSGNPAATFASSNTFINNVRVVADASVGNATSGNLVFYNTTTKELTTQDIPSFAVASNSVTTIATAATFTNLNWTTVESDTEGWFNSTTDRYSPLRAGWYQFTVSAACNGGGITNNAANGVLLRRNGTQVIGGSRGSIAYDTISALVYMNGTSDYVEGGVFASTTGSTTLAAPVVTQYFSGFWVRP